MTPTNSVLEDIFNRYIRVDMGERIDCESAIEEIAQLINKQIIEARKQEIDNIPDYGLDEPTDYACSDLNHAFNKCVKCYKERRHYELQASLNKQGDRDA